jgi:integrase
MPSAKTTGERMASLTDWLHERRARAGYYVPPTQLMHFAELDPNPARDRRVKLPRLEDKVVEPPSETAVAATIANAPRRWRLAIRVLEQTGMRIGELRALEWGDVDAAESRFRVATERRGQPAGGSTFRTG